MFCGTRSFKHAAPEERPALRKKKKKKSKRLKNPYSSRGLDKFSMVVRELEAKREKIVAKAKGGSTPLIRFMYTNSTKGWIPIIIWLHEDLPQTKNYSTKTKLNPIALPAPIPDEKAVEVVVVEKEVKRGLSWWRKWKPSYYWLVVMIVVLLGLVLGRVFAICCTSIWWYMLPNIKGECGHLGGGGDGRRRKSMKKKELARWVREKRFLRKMSRLPEMASPRSPWGWKESHDRKMKEKIDDDHA